MKSKRILMIPLDERPCNYRFPLLMPKAGFTLAMPPKELMGLKKRPGDTEGLANWLLENAAAADYAVVAMDTLIYGGLIPSRLHGESEKELRARADVLRRLKEKNPLLKIFAFQTVMRCPCYSLSDEEPDYYADCGTELHLYGRYSHKERLGALTEEEKTDFERVKKQIPQKALDDYTERRKKNLDTLLYTLEMVKEGIVDSFVVPQDDSAPYGFTSLDQQVVRRYLKENRMQLKVPVYPAADDTGMTMLARAVNDMTGREPKIYVYYASAKGPFVIPAFEDRSQDATIKNQIRAAGCKRVYSLPECDIFLAVNIGSEMLANESFERMTAAYDVERSLPEYVEQLKYALAEGKTVAVADVAHPGGSDLELLELLRDEGLLFKIHAYAGWNTSSNTLGTVICEACLYSAGKDERGNRDFLLHRYYDDVGYCSHTRRWIDENAVPKYGCTVFLLDGERGKCVEAAKGELMRYMGENFPEAAALVKDVDVSSPWNRTFEMDFIIKTKD